MNSTLMNSHKTALCAAVAFIFTFVFDWGFHVYLMMGTYLATADLWRGPAEMRALFPITIISEMVYAIAAVIIFGYGYQGKGRGEGLTFGFYLGSVMASMHLMCMANMPIPTGIVLAWISADYVKSVLIGVICAALLEEKAA